MPLVQRQNSGASEPVQRRFIGQTESEEPVRRKAADDKGGDLDAAAQHAVSTKGAGEPLRPAVRRDLESSMGADLSSVRMHEGPAARESAAALNARAFTHKFDIWLGQGESQDNTHLMAHEVTHVIQQGAAELGTSSALASRDTTVGVSPQSGAAGTATVPAPAIGAGVASSKAPPKTKDTASSTKAATASKGSASTGTASAAGAGSAEAKKRAKSPNDDPAFQAVVHNVKVTARGQKPKANQTGETMSGQAHAAVQSSAAEKPGRAAEAGISHLPEEVKEAKAEQQPKPFDKEAFKKKLTEKIAQKPPQNLEEADNVKSPEKAAELKASVLGEVDKDKTAAKQPAEKIDDRNLKPDAVPDLLFTPLKEPVPGAAPYLAAKGAAPKPASDEDISLEDGPRQLDQQMADSQITDEQLADSNEPQFQSALAQKEDVGKKAVSGPVAYRAQEAGILHAAETGAQAVATKELLAMHGAHTEQFAGVHADQTKQKAAEEAKRVAIYKTVNGMYLDTETAVNKRLTQLDFEINGGFMMAGLFDAGANEARDAFDFFVNFHMTKFKDERYSGKWGAWHWFRDKFRTLPSEVNEFYKRGYVVYTDHMSAVIDKIAAAVERGLNDALKIITDGQTKIQTFVKGLDEESQKIAAGAVTLIGHKFTALTQTVVDKQDELVNSLAKKYADSLQSLNEHIEKLKEANKGLVDKVVDAVKGVIEVIAHLKDLLLDVLSRAASAIGSIIAHPIRFLGHLVDAGMLGFNNFRKNIVEHLKDGFMQWLFGAVAKTGIELPKDFDLPGILSLVLQLLGLTYTNIRARAVDIVGENVVKGLETTAEIFKVLITKGPGGLWEYMQDKLGNILDTVIDSIKSFVMEKIIIAGVTWLIGLLNPASAFVKACKAIYDIVMFFVERGSQILDLVNAIIDSIAAIASGNIDKAADFIEKSLARAIPVIIGFLASLLGVDGISEKIQKIIDTIRKPVNEAIDWVIGKAVSMAKGLGGMLATGGKKVGAYAKAVGGKIANLFFPRKEFTVDSESHFVEARPAGDDYAIVIHSQELTMAEFIALAHKEAPKEASKLQKAFDAYNATKVDSKKGEGDDREQELDTKGKLKVKEYGVVADLIARIYPMIPSLTQNNFDTKIVYGGTDERGGTMMVAHPLSSDKLGEGSAPSRSEDFPPVWPAITKKRKGDDTRLYVKGHLLNNKLGGRGDKVENITPLTYSANARHNNQVESLLKDLVTKKSKKMVHYELHVNYPSSQKTVPAGVNPKEGELATSITANWHELVPKGKELVPHGPTSTDTIYNVPPYPQNP